MYESGTNYNWHEGNDSATESQIEVDDTANDEIIKT